MKVYNNSSKGKTDKKAWRESPEGKVWLKSYWNSPKYITYKKAWKKSSRGKASDKKWRESPEGKVAIKSWRESPEGKDWWNNHNQSYEEKLRKKIWGESPEGKATISRLRNKRRRNGKFVVNDLTASEWEEILQEQNHECLHLYDGCKGKFNEHNKPTKDHIIPLSKGGGLTKQNVQALCITCNCKKLAKVDDPDYIKHFLKNVRVMLGIC